MQNVFNIANIVAKRFVKYKNAFIMTKQKKDAFQRKTPFSVELEKGGYRFIIFSTVTIPSAVVALRK